MKTAITNARIVCSDRIIEGGTCLFEEGQIVSVGEGEEGAECRIDAKGA